VPKAKPEDDRLALFEKNAFYASKSGNAENAPAEDMQKQIQLFITE
jgi:hypothetical protein